MLSHKKHLFKKVKPSHEVNSDLFIFAIQKKKIRIQDRSMNCKFLILIHIKIENERLKHKIKQLSYKRNLRR